MNITDEAADRPAPPTRPALPDHARRRGELLALTDAEPARRPARAWALPLGAVAALAAVAVAAALVVPAATRGTTTTAATHPGAAAPRFTITAPDLVPLTTTQMNTELGRCASAGDSEDPTLSSLLADHPADFRPDTGFRTTTDGGVAYLLTADDQVAGVAMACVREGATVKVRQLIGNVFAEIAQGIPPISGRPIESTNNVYVGLMPVGTTHVTWTDPRDGTVHPVTLRGRVAFLDLVGTPEYRGRAAHYGCEIIVTLHAYGARSVVYGPPLNQIFLFYGLPAGVPHTYCGKAVPATP